MAQAELRTLLVDADLRNPRIADLLGLRNVVGLSSVLDGSASIDSGVQRWSSELWQERGLDVLTAGPAVPDPSELLASANMPRFLQAARSWYDSVILDSPALLDSSDGALLSAQADHAVVVVAASRTTQRRLLESLGRLRLAGADVVGVVLNRCSVDGAVAGYALGQSPDPHQPLAGAGSPGLGIGGVFGSAVSVTAAAARATAAGERDPVALGVLDGDQGPGSAA
jgi:capsular exopolysaccharide synthesis family protein